MAKLTLTDLANLQNELTAVAAINANSALIETAVENTLSRDGTSPNSMNADIDMNSKEILNLGAPTSSTSAARVQDLTSINAGENQANLMLSNQTLSGGANVIPRLLTTGSQTINCGLCPLQYITNGGAFTLTAPVLDGSCVILITNNASAGAITFTGFTVSSNVGDLLTTINGSKFSLFVWRINGISAYRISAHQN
jgi:hypothetical protein